MILNQTGSAPAPGVNGATIPQGLLNRANVFDDLPYLGYEIHQHKNMLAVTYDFSVLGGAVATINLNDDQGNVAYLPVGTIVTRAWLSVVTAVTSLGSATQAWGLTSTTDLLGATAKASLGTGFVDGVPAYNSQVSAFLQLTSSNVQVKVGNFVYSGKPVTTTIGTAALTAGKWYGYIEFVRSSTT